MRAFVRSVVFTIKTTQEHIDLLAEIYKKFTSILSQQAQNGSKMCKTAVTAVDCALAGQLSSSRSIMPFLSGLKIIANQLSSKCGTPALGRILTPMLNRLEFNIRDPPNGDIN